MAEAPKPASNANKKVVDSLDEISRKLESINETLKEDNKTQKEKTANQDNLIQGLIDQIDNEESIYGP
jgi:predicted transcriptional regulator